MLAWQWSSEDRDEIEVWDDYKQLRALITRHQVYDTINDEIVESKSSLVSNLALWAVEFAGGQLIPQLTQPQTHQRPHETNKEQQQDRRNG